MDKKNKGSDWVGAHIKPVKPFDREAALKRAVRGDFSMTYDSRPKPKKKNK